jgi:23S rRNA pseudouridine1911/1915/1917 synthase
MNTTRVSPLLDWLLRKHPDTPKSRAKQWILAGRVSVNGVIIRKPHQTIPDPGDALKLRDHQAATLDCGSGWQIHPRVSLLYLDAALAIVNKGPGLISVPASNCDLSALSILADFLAGKLKAQNRGVTGKSLPPAYCRLEPLPVHRLDQYTSGVFCMATNPAARHHLIEQLKAHTMKREYVALWKAAAGARRHLAAMAAIEPGRTAPARAFGNATQRRGHRGPRGHHALRSHRGISARWRQGIRHQIAVSGWRPAGNIKSASRPPTPDSR